MCSVQRVQLHDLVQRSGLDQLLQLPLLAVGGLTLECLEDDLHLVVILDGGAGGDDSGDLELGWTVLNDRRINLGFGSHSLTSAPAEHLVILGVVHLKQLS